MRRNTLDLDFSDWRKINHIFDKVWSCPLMIKGHIRVSPSMNGYHFEFWCKINCDLCRLVFDDQARYAADLGRPVYTRDVLWNSKSYKKSGTSLVLKTEVRRKF